jgi:hypothetical protein
MLPGKLLLDDGVKIIGVQNKARVISDLLRKTMPRRVALGLGAAGLMGSAGYGAAGLAHNALRGAVKPVPPPVPVPTPSAMPSFKGMGKYAPIAAVGAGGLAALAAAHAWGRSRRKQNPDEELSAAPA